MKRLWLATLSAVLFGASFARGGPPETRADFKSQADQPCEQVDTSLAITLSHKKKLPDYYPDAADAADVVAPDSTSGKTPAPCLDECLFDEPVCKSACQWRRPGSLWFGGADYLLWWFKDGPAPPPMAVQPMRQPIQPQQIDHIGGQTVLGGSPIDPGVHSGGMFTLGRWLDCDSCFGVQGGFFFLGARTTTQSVASNGLPGSPTLLLPYFNPIRGLEQATSIAQPGEFAGAATLASSSLLQGWEASGVYRPVRTGPFHRQWLLGVAHLNLTENLAFATTSPDITAPFHTFNTLDNFRTQNTFYGAQAGLRGTLIRGRWAIEGISKLAMGNMHQRVDTNGVLLTSQFDGLQQFPGGYFTQPTNIGVQTRDRFAVIPQTNINLAYNITCNLRARIGYTFLYVSSVARPGNSVDGVINPTQAPGITGAASQTLFGPARPAPLLHGSDFWAQGLNFGFDLAY